MKLTRLALRNFRNIDNCLLVPDKNLNFLSGLNGQGKTSILEAICYLATLRSFRGAKPFELMKWNSQFSEIACTVSDELDSTLNTEIKVTFTGGGSSNNKTTQVASVNGKTYKSSIQYLSRRFLPSLGAPLGSNGFHAIVFNPSDHDLIRGTPSIRRSYLDRVLAANDIEYLHNYQKYQRVLVQKNALLKAGQRQPQRDSGILMGFSEILVKCAAQMTFKRLEWKKRVSPFFNNALKQIVFEQVSDESEFKANIGLRYLSDWVPEIDYEMDHFSGHNAASLLELLERTFWDSLSQLEAIEWKVGHSLIGPHRDDWVFTLGPDKQMKGYSSQGEIRSVLLALKLAEVELFRETTGGCKPLFLLDDFSSELDHERRGFLLSFLSRMDLQVFITSTEEACFSGRRYWISNGELKEIRKHDGR